MMIFARRRAASMLTLVLATAVAGFTCDYPTEPELQSEDELSASSVSTTHVDGVVRAGGAGLRGVAVTLKAPDAMATAFTDAEGRFRVEPLTAGTYSASAKGRWVAGLPAEVNLFSLGQVEVDGPVGIGVDVPTHQWKVKVLLGGVPVPGARIHCVMEVRAQIADDRVAEGRQMMAGYTGQDGVFTSPVLPNNVQAGCSVFPLNTRWMLGYIAPAVTGDWVKTVHVPGFKYSGALSARGTPVGGQTLQLFGPLKRELETTAEGAYSFTLTPGDYRVALSGGTKDGLVPAEFELTGRALDGIAERQLVSTTTETLDLPVPMLTLAVTGVGGAPVVGASVDQVIEGASFPLGGWRITKGWYRVRATSGEDGVLRIPFFPGSGAVELDVRAPEGSAYLDGSIAFEGIADDTEATLSLTSSNTAPTAVAGGPYAVAEGGTVVLDGSASFDAEGDALTYEWLLPDGSVVDGATAEASFADGPSDHVAVLTVTDAGGLSSSAEAAITVANVAPTVEAEGATVTSGESFELATSFADPGADTWRWLVEWGDGRTSEGDADEVGALTVPSPVFLASGDYTVRVTVTDDDGDEGSAEVTLTVLRLPVPLDVLPGSAENPLALNLVGNGLLPVAVLTVGSFDATALDVSSILLRGDGQLGVPVSKRPNGTYMASSEDVNGDGRADLLLHFERKRLVREHLTLETTRLVLHGTTVVGVEVEGVDAVRPQ